MAVSYQLHMRKLHKWTIRSIALESMKQECALKNGQQTDGYPNHSKIPNPILPTSNLGDPPCSKLHPQQIGAEGALITENGMLHVAWPHCFHVLHVLTTGCQAATRQLNGLKGTV